jgi:hypothetical protein
MNHWLTWGLVVGVAAACSDGKHRLGGEYPEATGGAATGGAATGGAATGGAATGGAATGGETPARATGGRPDPGGGDALWAAGVAGDGPLPSAEEDVRQTQLMADERMEGQQALLTSDAEGQAMAWATATGIHAAVSNSSTDPLANWFVPFEEPIATSTQPGVLRLVGLGRAKTENVHVLYLERDEEAEIDQRFKLMARYHDYFLDPEGFDPAVELSRLGEGDLEWPEVAFAHAANNVGAAAWFDAAAGGCRVMTAWFEEGSGWLTPEVVAELGESCGSELMLSIDDNARGVLAWLMPESAEDPGLYSVVSSSASGWESPRLVDSNVGDAHLVAGDGGSLWVWRQDEAGVSARSYTTSDGWSGVTMVPGTEETEGFLIGSEGIDGARAYFRDARCHTYSSRFRAGVGWSAPKPFPWGQALVAFDTNLDGDALLLAHTVDEECSARVLLTKLPTEAGGRYVLGMPPPWGDLRVHVDDEGQLFYAAVSLEPEPTVEFGWARNIPNPN